MNQPLNKVTVSAGGIVVNTQGMILVVNQRGTSWSLPKGHIDVGEEPLHAAQREIKEESGISQLEFVKPLGIYGRFKIDSHGGDDHAEWKIIIFFLFKTKQQHLLPEDPDNPQARWVHPNEVEMLLTHPKDQAFFKSIRSLIQ